ncbi:MAG: ribonuclease HII [Holosporales bacterium]|jgi:ribonuclease HII|nr:ribonuclease HII [Holosporales bacterium]
MPSFEYEFSFAPQCVAGVDEVGRGPWAGPVVAASVIVLNKTLFLEEFAGIDDSKKISKKMREIFFNRLKIVNFIKFNVGIASVEEIDSLNILNATFLAMNRALEGMKADIVIVDGNKAISGAKIKTIPIIKGDSKSYSIAAASIIAKVSRDNIMTDLARNFPEYKWNENSGYGTKAHRHAILEYGICCHHRKSYAPIKNKYFACS